MKLIDKDALVAEIEKWISGWTERLSTNPPNPSFFEGGIEIGKYILSFINTLKVKEVDLNKELSLEDYKSFFKRYPDLSDDWGFEEAWTFAKHFFELGMAVSNKQIEEKEDINSQEESNIVYKDITMIDKDGNTINAKIKQREKV